jgi:hypothetical protein
MKTKTLAAFATICCTFFLGLSTAIAQPAAGLGIGYNFGAGGGYLGSSSTSTYDHTTTGMDTYSDKGLYGSWGQGFDIDGWFEDMLCECFGIGAQLSYDHGRKFKLTDNTTDIYTGFTQTRVDEYSGSLNRFSINPYVKVQCCEYFGIKPYGRIGFDLNLLNSMKQVEDGTATNVTTGSTMVTKEEEKVKGKLNFGLDAAAGFRLGLGNSMSFYGELDYRTSSFMPDKLTVTKYTEDGADKLSTWTTYQKETDYKKSISSTTPSSASTPAEALAYKAPASSLGLRLGIAYEFAGYKATPKGEGK